MALIHKIIYIAIFIAISLMLQFDILYVPIATVLLNGILYCHLVKRVGFFSFPAVFMIVTSLYTYTGIVDLFFFGNVFELHVDNVALLAYLNTLFWIVFVVFLKGYCPDINGEPLMVLDRRSMSTFDILVLSTIIILLIIELIILGPTYQLESRATEYISANPLTATIRIAIFSLLILYNALLVTKKINFDIGSIAIFLLSAIVIYCELMIYGDRRMAVSYIVSLIFCFRYYLISKYTGSILILAFIFLMLFGTLRNIPVIDWAEAIIEPETYLTLMPSNTEFIYFSDIFNKVLESSGFNPNSLSQQILQVIPKFIFETRGEPSSVLFINYFYPEWGELGWGVAYNLLLDPYLNFGIFGVAMLSGFFVFLANISMRPDKFVFYFINSCMLFLYVFAFRYDVTSMLKISIIFIIAPILILLFKNFKRV